MFENRVSIAKFILVLALAVLVIQVGLALANYFYLARLSLSFPYPIDYGEGPILDQTLRLSQGENIYDNDFSTPPYTVTNYPPLFMLAQVPWIKIFGPAFWYGRALSILSALLAALFIALTLFTLTRDWIASAIGGLLLLVYPYTQYWSVLNRVDLFGLALSWAGIYVAARWRDTRWGIPAAGLLMVAAIYSKQTYALAAPAGIFFWLLLERQPRKAFTLAGVVAGASLALFLALNLSTRGGFFLNIVTANVNPFYWKQVNRYIVELATNSFYLFFIVAIFLIAERAGDRTKTWALVLPYLLAAGLGAISVGKDGSNVNYMLEAAGAISFAAGAGLAWMGRSNWVRLVVLLVVILQVNAFTQWARESFNGNVEEKIAQREDIARLADFVKQTDGIILADEYMGLIPLYGRRLYYQPFEFKMLAESGDWDETPFLRSIQNNEYQAILQYQPYTWAAVINRWTPDMRSYVRSYYNLSDTIAYTWIFRPKK